MKEKRIPTRYDDTLWIDVHFKKHVIADMSTDHAEACIRLCHNRGCEIPDALIARWKQRHTELGKMIRNLDEEN